jgi:hypothetical protein
MYTTRSRGAQDTNPTKRPGPGECSGVTESCIRLLPAENFHLKESRRSLIYSFLNNLCN